MNAEIVNLRRARKARNRGVAAKQTDQNRLQFGRSRAQRDAALQETVRLDYVLDGARRESPPE